MKYWVSSPRATFCVETDSNDIIIDIAPIGRKFLGQFLENLKRFFRVDQICELSN